MSTAPAAIKTAQPGVSIWPKYPVLYEINTWIWLADLSRKYSRNIDLSSVPSSEWDAVATYGFDAVWLMGVWERSPAGIAIANRNQGLLQSFREALPDFQPADNVGSPYSIRRYAVDPHLGGPTGLATARTELSSRGINLILDFVPNHVAPDNPWACDHPEYFISGNSDDVKSAPSCFIELQGSICACGRDPFFPPWPDVLQLNAFNVGLRKAVIETISGIALQCDGIRCDMGMLVLNPIFERTWGSRAGQAPATEYWADVISTIKNEHPGFLFIAEAYWDLEWDLQQKGFDFCYDKKLYDRLEHGNAENVRLHLCADLAYQDKLLRFLENHDEPRASTTFLPAKLQAVAVAIATLPGAKLFYEGQFEGRKIRPPVFLGRRPDEPADRNLQQFYQKLLAATVQPIFREGTWNLLGRTGWPNNTSFQNLVAWGWSRKSERYLVVINLSDSPSQAQIQIPWPEIEEGTWQLIDPLSGANYRRSGKDMLSPGLFVDLQPWNFHFFRLVRSEPI
jgi:glycosidase